MTMENLNCFNMKTEQEIKEWLESRPWFKKFKRNLEKQAKLTPELQKTVYDILEGQYGYSTISAAFNWETTPEGTYFWAKRNTEFIRWLDYGWESEDEGKDYLKYCLCFIIFVCGFCFCGMIMSAFTGVWGSFALFTICCIWLAYNGIRLLKNVR